jgi:hypothetical protein
MNKKMNKNIVYQWLSIYGGGVVYVYDYGP